MPSPSTRNPLGALASGLTTPRASCTTPSPHAAARAHLTRIAALCERFPARPRHLTYAWGERMTRLHDAWGTAIACAELRGIRRTAVLGARRSWRRERARFVDAALDATKFQQWKAPGPVIDLAVERERRRA